MTTIRVRPDDVQRSTGHASILVGQVNGNTLFIRTATPSAGGTAAADSDRPYAISVVCP
ncbi:hypothetical protein PV721_12280 [Streptomyces sp. MB09-01]|uniref:hypothetical protein n=1 Tax=Streptomyces sp. MB09-01 TaxID=3028666 RepID=UPI0029B17D07|nr:hypothetical protein [Streptomyces sp. MB09-01]MDX3535137.1 hypothetical protein [Streptomyces sp. MB09-01]